jgi:hypothetical protein
MTRTPFRQLPLVVITVVSLVASACAGSGGGPTAPSSPSGPGAPSTPTTPGFPDGIYQFAAVNGQAVPCVFDEADLGLGVKMSMQAIRGRLILNPDHTYLHEYEMWIHSTLTETKKLTKASGGTFTFNGGLLVMTPVESGVAYQPHYTPGQIEIQTEVPGLDGNPEVFVFTYRK